MLLSDLISVFLAALSSRVCVRDTSPQDTSIEVPEHPNDACKRIEEALSSASNVYWPSTGEYEQDIRHYALSSVQIATCSVEPGTPEDIGVILTIVGSTNTPFAVKSGGHTTNPGFSSTTGVQISMNRFHDTIYDSVTKTARVGTGQIWDDVYAALEPFGVNVVGGRVTGIGVGGLLLGGGYSYLTNQYGLAIDNVLAFELVLPNGTVTEVTALSNPDLYFALRGGSNNFGIVTTFTLRTYPQTKVWGGYITYSGDSSEELREATLNFINKKQHPKAAILSSFGTTNGLPSNTLYVFYDAPTVPNGLYDEFLAIDHLQADVSTRSFLSLVRSPPFNSTEGLRARYHTVSVSGHSKNFTNAIINETMFWTQRFSEAPFESPVLISYVLEPFLPNIFTHGSDSAYPPDRSRALYPLCIWYAWKNEDYDDDFVNAIKTSAETITAAADSEGQNVGNAALYGNYAVDGTLVTRIYGQHFPRLKDIKGRYDPENVMGLTGGWKL